MTVEESNNLKLGGAVIAALGILYFVLRKRNTNGTIDPEVSPNPTISFNAKDVAEGLYDAMNRMGTDNNSILELLRSVSPGQFMLVSRAFGLKPYNNLLGNDYGFFLDSYPLKAWLKKEVSPADYAILKNKYLNQL